ncbi:hypothetical protein [Rathayibacter tanaceti]|uniref:Phenylacetate-coenzyme A ligase n=2 Tax=Rathayibacter tanaceti TaxID=1671680 RepID=A0A166IPL3_9MICO|nr:hypothetical protein [Rathayibacter tanaceti]KZX22722.1 Phenylacetate-coenzyme A ligase [Rathayibacter tanaceti]QHC55910.1 hypothetical protein GSU10_09895 [Rathayibacter tanaceti]TCO39257.1 hypothetical protein EV639_101199 [Rathayibacter tanaceti]
MRLEPLPTEQSALDAAQDRSFAAMRDAIAASETCTAYTRVVDALRPDRIDEIEVLDRARLAAWGADAVAPNSITTGDVRIVLRSSGSSGSIRTVRHSAGFNDQVGFLGARGIGMGGLPRNPLVVNALAPGDLFGGFGFAEDALARRGAAVLPAGSAMDPDALADVMAGERVDAIVAVPGQIGLLHARRPEAFDSIRVAYYLGDRPRRDLRSALAASGVELRSFALSTTETGPIGFQCEHLSGPDHHLHEDLVHVQILGPDGRPVPEGVLGTVAVTPLVDSGLALVRYLVGDEGTQLGRRCRCGSPSMVLRLGSREGTSTNIRGTLVTEAMVRGALPVASSDVQLVVEDDGQRFGLVLCGPGAAGVEDSTLAPSFLAEPTLAKVLRTRGFAGIRIDRDRSPAHDRRGKQPFFFRGGTDR